MLIRHASCSTKCESRLNVSIRLFIQSVSANATQTHADESERHGADVGRHDSTCVVGPCDNHPINAVWCSRSLMITALMRSTQSTGEEEVEPTERRRRQRSECAARAQRRCAANIRICCFFFFFFFFWLIELHNTAFLGPTTTIITNRANRARCGRQSARLERRYSPTRLQSSIVKTKTNKQPCAQILEIVCRQRARRGRIDRAPTAPLRTYSFVCLFFGATTFVQKFVEFLLSSFRSAVKS